MKVETIRGNVYWDRPTGKMNEAFNNRGNKGNFRIVTKVYRDDKTNYGIEYLEADKWVMSPYDCYKTLKDCEDAIGIVIKAHMKKGLKDFNYIYYNNKGEKV